MTGNPVFVEQGGFRGKLPFSFVVAMIGCFYFILVPFACYICQTVMMAHRAVMPRGIASLNPLSPWLPLTIGALGIGLLFWTQASNRKNRLGRLSAPASAVIILFGALWVALTLLPVLQLMAALRG